MSTERLIVAVPSKGRLQENANAFFARAGIDIQQPGGARNYRGRLKGLDQVEVAFLSASEIAGELAAGSVHLGITGRDLVEETIRDWPRRVDLAMALGFGFADVVVAVPQAWIDVRSMADLDDIATDFRARHGRRLQVATKYLNLTRQFFAGHGIADYRIVESLGATEGAPAAGTADLIVDITTTGATLRANSLKVLPDGTILRSEAYLAASLAASWTPPVLDGLRAVLDRIEAEAAGRRQMEVRADVARPGETAALAKARFAATAPFGTSAPLTLHCPARDVAACAEWLRTECGAGTVAVTRLERVFSAGNPDFDRLSARLEEKD